MLIGLPGAGKTTAAPIVAGLLQCPWCDLDERIVAAAEQSIHQIFAHGGEKRFRALEHAAMLRAAAERPQVIAAGAGWAAIAGNLDAVADRVLTVYLSLPPAEAARRLAGVVDRPMLTGGSTEARIAGLLAIRDRWYRLADLEIAAGEVPPEVVAAGIATAARQYGGW